ncbi:hypothetical protein [uncultured Thiothrix sp.]|uniref:hypothetical protein n=1 Tax=uncultured Thiothrix sp. TaxID=223185 RepID=UPI002635E9A2|nr:hypothetical protein [uncultured Thiothrix sp.]
MESIIKPLLDATIQSVEASDPTTELQAQIDNATEGSTLVVPSGNYETITINKSITLNGQEPPPNIKRINASNISQLTLDHLDIGNKDLNSAQVRALPESETGIRVVLSDKPTTINITNTQISGVADGISISSHKPSEQTAHQKITIDNNTISNIQRDGIILKNIGQYTISNNDIHSIHPNYEPIPYEQLKKTSKAPDAAVTLPNGVLAQHADGIQVTNAKGGNIRNNELSIGNGTWYQAINVHHEADSPYRNTSPKVPKDNQPISVFIVGNTIENNHDFAINAQHYTDIHEIDNSFRIKQTGNRLPVEKMGFKK